MNIRILAASALALAILVPAANAAIQHRQPEFSMNHAVSGNGCLNGNLNQGTMQCVPFHAKVVQASMVKRVAKPASAY